MRATRSIVFAACLLIGVVGAPAQPPLEVIDFGDLLAGTIVTEVYGSQGTGPVKVDGYNERFGEGTHAAVIFDTANPTGEDFDLGAPNETFEIDGKPGPGKGRAGIKGAKYENALPLGKLLIIGEDLAVGTNGLVTDPDDEGQYRDLSFTLDFSEVGPVTLYWMTLIDVEEQERTPGVKMYDANDALISAIDLPITGDNGVVRINLGPTEKVSKMVVQLHGSGAISSFRFIKEGPRVAIETLTNGIDADLVTDQEIPWLVFGAPVYWSYEVTNTGTEPLRDMVVTDDRGVTVDCSKSSLEPGEKTVCSASGPALNLALPDLGFTPVRGLCQSRSNQLLYGNVGSVTAVGITSAVAVSASDPSHYCSSAPRASIYVRKEQKGADSRAIPSGSDATFKVVVWNNGTMDLTDIKVADVLTPDCNRQFGRLGAGKSTSYSCTAPAVALGGENVTGCSFVNEVVASGQGGNETVTDSDTSTIELIGLRVDKGFTRAEPDTAYFDITVSNDGCDLDSVKVTDELAPDCERDLGAIAGGDSRNYSCSMPLVNEACAEAVRSGATIGSCDTATFVITPGGDDDDENGDDDDDGGGKGGTGGRGDEGGAGGDDGIGVEGGGKKPSAGLLLLLLALLAGGGLFAWNRMKAG